MSRRPNLTPWQELEEQAYHAYREWPLFLKLRLRELRRHLPKEAFAKPPDPPPQDVALLKEYGLMGDGEDD